ncbi:YeeE/YedE family protein [Tardiphaga sp.]|uniref:YeeE/YedE family protein n=1 Tax=Tardiphaga sp. TaxID=1926292 RepID=UPI00352A1E55
MGELFAHALPFRGLVGGLMIGVASAIMLLGLGRIAGVSGLAARAAGIASDGAPRVLAIAFIVGLPIGAALITLILGPVEARFEQGFTTLILAGLLVGFGTRMGSGCTSGHGVCGMSRLSIRSLIATIVFILAGIVTVALMNAMGVRQ